MKTNRRRMMSKPKYWNLKSCNGREVYGLRSTAYGHHVPWALLYASLTYACMWSKLSGRNYINITLSLCNDTASTSADSSIKSLMINSFWRWMVTVMTAGYCKFFDSSRLRFFRHLLPKFSIGRNDTSIDVLSSNLIVSNVSIHRMWVWGNKLTTTTATKMIKC